MKIKFLLCCCALVCFFCGCQNSVNSIGSYEKTMRPKILRDSRFITDDYLKDRLGLVNVITSKTVDSDLLRVQLEVINLRTGGVDQFWSNLKGDNPYKIRYKFTWFTADGMSVPSLLSDWQTTTIKPGETQYLQSVAPNAECTDFEISIIEAR